MGYLLAMHPPNRIRELRRKAGLSQEELGEQVGLSAGQVSHLENGVRNLTVEWMRRLARPLGVTPQDLLVDEDAPDRLTPEERAIIQGFRDAPPEAKHYIERMIAPQKDTRVA
ncbi:MAG: helix-turn-helix transcriptional regulator [Paracoccaceae bacterium]